MGGLKEEVSIFAAVEKLEGSLVRTRTEGLEALRRIFGQDRASYRVNEISDDSFHKILEAVFRIVRTEKPNYIRATSSTSKNASSSRLASAASALRVIIEAVGTRLKQKTASAVLDHVIDILPDADGSFCSPLQSDYLKIFVILLNHAPRGEHLRPKQWQTYVDFVIDNITESMNRDIDDDDLTSTPERSGTFSRNGLSMSLRISQSSTSRGQVKSSIRHSEEILLEDLLVALKHLTSATNAPLATRINEILDMAVHWLELMSRSEETAFEVLNYVLPTALTEDIMLAVTIFGRTCQIIQQRDLWTKRSINLKENILATMTLCRSLFLNTNMNSPSLTVSTLESLLHILRSEYEKRPDRDYLQVDDLSFSACTHNPMFSLDGFAIPSDQPRVTNAWSTLSVMRYILEGIAKNRLGTEQGEQEEASHKRRKLEDPIEELFRQATSSNAPGQLVALQLALFVVGDEDQLFDVMASYLSRTPLTDLEDEPTIASWTCLLLARFVTCHKASTVVQPQFWKRVWSWACRAAATSVTTRPACYLLCTIVQSRSISSVLSAQTICEGIFPDGTSGLSALTDGAILLLQNVLTSGMLDTEKSFKYFTSHILRWLDHQWTISSVPDRLHNSQMASFARSDDLYLLFTSIAGNQVDIEERHSTGPTSVICKALLTDATDLAFTHYMMSEKVKKSPENRPVATHMTYIPSSLLLGQCKQAIIDLLINKMKSFLTSCRLSSGERHSVVNLDVIETLTTICVLCHIIAKSFESDTTWPDVRSVVDPVWNVVQDFLLSQSSGNFYPSFSKVAERLTSIRVRDQQIQTKLVTCLYELNTSLQDVLRQNKESQGQQTVLDLELMDSNDIKLSQSSQQRASQTNHDTIRSDLAISHDTHALFARQCLALKLDLARYHAERDPSTSYGGMVVDAIIALEPEDMLATRDIITGVLNDKIVIARGDAARLLTTLAKTCLQDETMARCEAALCLCLRIATSLARLWTADQDDDLEGLGYDVYAWFINVALGKAVASQRVLLSLAHLLENILRFNPSYGTESLPSARTSLLQILQTAQTGLKFRLVDHLSNLFNGYILSEHSAVYDDIIDNLPSDPDKREGIVLRLYIIASLGARWHTILRQSVYHIFETAANVPSTITIAAKCAEMVCDQLSLKSSQELFHLFSSQVLYTWLEKQSVESVPFQAFGFSSLTSLASDIQEELVAQIAMRSSTEHAQNVVRSLGISWDGLIERWFAKSVAYAIVNDVAINRSSRPIGKAEMNLIQQLGEESYARLCRTNFAKAVSTILLRLTDDRGFDKVDSQNEDLQHYTATYNMICSYSSSQMQLPPGQQPSFRVKHLIHILDRMCMRAQETLDSSWTPALLIHVYRALLADAKPSFGPLHTCAVLRKIRVVICLSGTVALSGYPLQMLLHALRPFLTQFHSSEDAFGIFRYLLEQGRAYLSQKLPFVVGLGVAIFASLSRFASSSQESTTQESHFLATMNKAQQFRLWLGKYLEGFDAVGLNDIETSTFANIVQAAKQIAKSGSSAKTTAEGALLYYLLADQASNPPLLSNTFFRLTLRSLCYDFIAAADFQDDILFKDEDVLRIAPVLWEILGHQSTQSSFQTWVLQAVGRAYALRGPSITELHLDGRHNVVNSDKSAILIQDSYQSIVNVLGDLLWDENSTFASVSEATLQSIFSALPIENKTIVLGRAVDQSMLDDLRFVELTCPPVHADVNEDISSISKPVQSEDGVQWASKIVKKLCVQQKSDQVLSFLPALIELIPSIAPEILPYVVHLTLHFEVEQIQQTKESLTNVFKHIFDDEGYSRHHIQLALKTIIYLRRCVLPVETTMAKRNEWLAIDYGSAARAALRCEMYRMSLLLLEIHVSQNTLAASRSSRRSSLVDPGVVPDILGQIYQNVDDPDFFYGTHEESDVASIVEKLSHEGHGYKAVSFQSALFDSDIRTGGLKFALDSSGSTTASALNLANLNGLSTSIGTFVMTEHKDNAFEHSTQSLLNLHQWNVAHEKSIPDHSRAPMAALKALSTVSLKANVIAAADRNSLELAQGLLNNVHRRALQVSYWTSLAVLAEIKEMLSVQGVEDLTALLDKRALRRTWTEYESFDWVEPILLGREAMFATIKNNSQLRNMMGLTAPQAILLEIKALRASLSLGHVHEMSQFCLNRAAYLSALLPSAKELGVKVEVAIQYDLANTFWAQQETAASIRILQRLYDQQLPDQAIEVRQSEILTDLGSKITEARLDRPDEVTGKYLIPAIKALGKETMGSKVGRVFHNFAAFCDNQLRDPDNVDEFERVEKIRNRKLQEVTELDNMLKKADSKGKETVRSHHTKAKTWLKLDDEELQRLKAHRDRLVRNCLENYLLALRACEDFPNDVLRFLALWMEQSGSVLANQSVSKHLSSVPTYKFAPLMNQLSSRILYEESPFQQLLLELMYHICEDHPFHGLYQVFATSKSKGAQKDEVANSRHKAATRLSEKVMKRSKASSLWISIHNTNIQFVRVAQEKTSDRDLKTGSKFLLRNLPQGAKLEQTVHDLHHRIPPPTMKVDVRPDKDYSKLPTISKFEPQFSIAGGVSAPKIITLVATDGSRHKMLLKGGNDDLRQDSIMEQVFEQVSNLLKDHRATRQRKLGIRTYKVIPLTHNAGIIEFVRDTLPLNDYLLPAHTRYYPKDYKPNRCRKEIADVQSKSLNSRVQAYRHVCSNFHPIMRFFFMEHFLDPDDWFQKRLNYSRSSAAISMLGHVLGLGDRHGHNILLDTETGEVIHIDLGVAFEAGRVLPVPEVVPFRLTRDLVDGMGLSGVEGVFRRCCNFTLEALRRNQEAIMTILDVLRWDPLYSWSVSPLRLARMQQNQEQAANADASAAASTTTGESEASTSVAGGVDGAAKPNVNEPSEADRALAIVSKKLGKSLSVEATVNELIRQALDERNLAVLYCGWAAYA